MSNIYDEYNSSDPKSELMSHKLDYDGFLVWFFTLRRVLRLERKLYVINEPLPEMPSPHEVEDYVKWRKHLDDSIYVTNLIKKTTIPFHMKGIEALLAFDLVEELKEIFHEELMDGRDYLRESIGGLKMGEFYDIDSFFNTLKCLVGDLKFLGGSLSHSEIVTLLLHALGEPYIGFIEESKLDLERLSLDEIQSLIETIQRQFLNAKVKCGACGRSGRVKGDTLEPLQRYLFNYRSHLSYKV